MRAIIFGEMEGFWILLDEGRGIWQPCSLSSFLTTKIMFSTAALAIRHHVNYLKAEQKGF